MAGVFKNGFSPAFYKWCGYTVVELNQLKNYQWEEPELNDIGHVVKGWIMCPVWNKGKDWFYVYLARYNGLFYASYKFERDNGSGASCGICVKNNTPGATPVKAITNLLESCIALGKGWFPEACKLALGNVRKWMQPKQLEIEW